MKKAMLLTVALTLLTLIILSLAIIISSNSKNSGTIASKTLVLDRVYEMSSSIDKILMELFVNSGISINISDNTISFEETVPNNNLSFFNLSMDNFKEFIESNYSNIKINTTIIKEQLPLIILPNKINYTHAQLGGNEIIIYPTTINFQNYTVSATFTENITSCPSADVPQTPHLFVEAFSSGAKCPLTELGAEAKVYTQFGFLKLKLESGKLTIIVNNTIANLKTKIALNPMPNTKITVYYPPIVYINFTDFGIYKEGKPKIR